jgi:hypothetical protein
MKFGQGTEFKLRRFKLLGFNTNRQVKHVSMLLEQFVNQRYYCYQKLPLVWYILRSITLINAWVPFQKLLRYTARSGPMCNRRLDPCTKHTYNLVSAINEPILKVCTTYQDVLAISGDMQSTFMRALEIPITEPNTLACKRCYKTRAFRSIL